MGSRIALENGGCLLKKLALPLIYLVGMDTVALGKLRNRLLFSDGRQCDFCLETRAMFASRVLHGSCSFSKEQRPPTPPLSNGPNFRVHFRFRARLAECSHFMRHNCTDAEAIFIERANPNMQASRVLKWPLSIKVVTIAFFEPNRNP